MKTGVLLKGCWVHSLFVKSLAKYSLMLILGLKNEALSLSRFLEADLFILPPDSVFSDADSNDENEPQNTNHLSSRKYSVANEMY